MTRADLLDLARRLRIFLHDLALLTDNAHWLYAPFAWSTGSFIAVRYRVDHDSYHLTPQQAERYIAWLASGQRGTHRDMQRQAPQPARPEQGASA